MKQLTAVCTALIILLCATITFAGIGSKEAAYVGGSVVAFSSEKDPVIGELDTTNNDLLRFVPKDKKHSGKTLAIPYSNVVDIEYGQKAGRRVGAAVGTAVLLGPIGLVTLFSKKRKHYVTIGFKDNEGKDQVAVIECGKDIIRTTLAIIETRSGKKIEYQDKEAEKAGRG